MRYIIYIICYLFLAATVMLSFASCADATYLGDQEGGSTDSGSEISFGHVIPSPTRGTSEDAAKLGNYFVVYGEKGETDRNRYAAGHLVFPNYTVHYQASTANTTTSNTNNWEYVGVTPLSTTYVQMDNDTQTSATQTIKYWDFAADSYTFTAISARKEDVESGRVTIRKITESNTDKYDKGYTITLAKTPGTGEDPDIYADLDNIFYSDRKEVPKANYREVVQMNFRNTICEVRAGMYETIPGYEISAIKFYVNENYFDEEDAPQTRLVEAKDKNGTPAFGAICPNTATEDFTGTLKVTYYNDGEQINQPKVVVEPGDYTTNPNLILGTNLNTITRLGETADNPSWDREEGEYTEVLPQGNATGSDARLFRDLNNPTADPPEENVSGLKLICDYTLHNTTTGETINVKGVTAYVPKEDVQWQANFKYTYLFKITDNLLNPITLDAIIVTDINGNQQTITTVDDPSITTYQNGTKVTETNYKYKTGTIYVVVGDGIVLTGGDNPNAKLYTVVADDGYAGGLSEANMADALINGSKNDATNPTTWTRHINDKNLTLTSAPTDALTPFDQIPAADSPTEADLSINGAKFTAAAGTTYVFQYMPLITPAVLYTEEDAEVIAGTKQVGEVKIPAVYETDPQNCKFKVIKVQ